MKETISICPYCGCGCRIGYVSEKGKLVKINPVKDDEVSRGKPCIKGLTVHEVLDKNRILSPMIRKNGKLRKASWDAAIKHMLKNAKHLAPAEIMLTASGKAQNEDNYVIQKFARVCLGTNNIDSCCTRLCHASTVAGMENCLGVGNITKMENIGKIDTLFIIGSNPAGNYPVFFDRMAEKKGRVKFVSVQHWNNPTSRFSDISAVIEPCTEVAFLNGIISEVIKSGEYDKAMEKTEGFEKLMQTAKKFDIKTVCRICSISKGDFMKIANAVKESKRIGVFHGMGFTQQVNSIENVHSLLNLMILKKGIALTLRGEVNVQGAGDMGCLPYALPNGGYENAGHLEKLWKHKVPLTHGKTITEAFLISPAKAFFIYGFNPAQSLPNLGKVHSMLRKSFVVQISPYFDKTSNFADVILPSLALPECAGTITNGERRVRKLCPSVKSKGLPAWRIFAEIAKAMGCGRMFAYKSERQIFEEIARAVPAYSKINISSLYNGEDAWADKEIKHTMFRPEKFEGVDDARSKKYPLLLITHRSKFQFLTAEMTSESKTLMKAAEKPGFYLNSRELRKKGLRPGDKVIAESPAGSVKGKAWVDNNLPDRIMAASFHSKKLLVNRLYPAQFDEETFTPNYKAVAVSVKKA